MNICTSIEQNNRGVPIIVSFTGSVMQKPMLVKSLIQEKNYIRFCINSKDLPNEVEICVYNYKFFKMLLEETFVGDMLFIKGEVITVDNIYGENFTTVIIEERENKDKRLRHSISIVEKNIAKKPKELSHDMYSACDLCDYFKENL